MTIELRSSRDFKINDKKIVGRPVVYDSLSEDLGGFKEIIKHGAFSDSLQSDIRALVEHQPTLLLGRTSAKTLSIIEDNEGLNIEIIPPDIQSARDLMVSIERGDIRGMSFGFSVPAGGESWDYEQSPPVRTVTRAKLHEITVTSMPAYQATNVSVALRSLERNRSNCFKERLTLLELV